MKRESAEDERKKAFIEGFREGIEQAFAEIEKMLARGYENQELKVIVPTRKMAIHKDIDQKMSEWGFADQPQPRDNDSIPVMEPGDSLIAFEREPDLSLQVIRGLRDSGSRILALVRTDPRRFSRLLEGDKVQMKWLSTTSGAKAQQRGTAPLGLAVSIDDMPQQSDDFCIKPTDLSRLDMEASKFYSEGEEGAVFLEKTDYLITQNDFKKVLKMLQHIREEAVLKKGYLIVSLNPESIEPREASVLGGDMTYILRQT